MATVLETVEDQKKEEIGRAYLEYKFKCTCINMPKFSPVDCIMIKPVIGTPKVSKVAGVEFKFRNVNYDDYPDIWLEESKQLALVSCKDVWDKAYFMPCFNGELYMIEVVDTLECSIIKGGRTDRDIDDIDQMVAIDMDKLKKIGRVW